MRIAELSSDSNITPDELSDKIGSLVSAQKTIAMQKTSVINIIKDHYGQHVGASADGDQLVIPENLDKGKGKALVEAFETYLRSRISQFWPILPFLNRIISDFDTYKKTFYKPPCIINDKAQIPEEFRELYIDAAKFLFSEIKLALNAMPNVMARLRSSFIYGEGNGMGLCSDIDGPMALFSLIYHYRVSSNDNQGRNPVLSLARKKLEIKIFTQVQVQTRPKALMKSSFACDEGKKKGMGRVQDCAGYYHLSKWAGSRLL